MLKDILNKYLKDLQTEINRGDTREESLYPCLKDLLEAYARLNKNSKCGVTVLPKSTEAGNPDFRVWQGEGRITGYIEAKKPETYNLEPIASSEQLKRYLATFPNLILTNFYEFRLYQHGNFIESVTIASPINATQMQKTPPLAKVDEFANLLERYFSFSLPAFTDPKNLAEALAKRTLFLREQILVELAEEEKQDKKVLLGFYESFKKMLINNLSLKQFADLFAQTLTYGIFAARTRSEVDFSSKRIYEQIPSSLGILKSILEVTSLGKTPPKIAVWIEDIVDILQNTEIRKIMERFYTQGKGSDPIVHFYESFLSEYDPKLRESRGVYYTPEPVVGYIVRAIHSLLKSHFGMADGLASEEVTILDPAAGTLTFPAEAISLAIQEHRDKYGDGGIHNLIKRHILPNFYAIELMMAPYTVGHLKISYLLAEHGYEFANDERFKLYLSNTLEPDTPEQISLPIAQDISDECVLANEVKHQEPILVILGNPPYSGASENINDWTEKLLKTDLDGAQSYYTVDGKPLGERNTKWLQDDYVKFLRFAQWKIHKAGKGIVGMITNHGYLDNPTFRGMRQSLMKTFDEIYVLDLHGNSLKKEVAPDGGKDENVFDIRQGTAIVLMLKRDSASKAAGDAEREPAQVFHHELYGLRQNKYDWLDNNSFQANSYQKINPGSPFYLFQPVAPGSEHYLKWTSLPEIFPLNSVGIATAKDKLTIRDTENELRKTIHHFASLDIETAREAFKLGRDTQDWKVDFAQKDLKDSGLSDGNIVPILYRPFDIRYTYYTGRSRGFHGRPRPEVMLHMQNDNKAFVLAKRVESDGIWEHLMITNCLSTNHSVSIKESNYVFPLYLYPDEQKEDIFASEEREYNISQKLLERFSGLWQDFQPQELFYYSYAVLHSNEYRKRFAQYLRIDFPRIPFPDDYEIFKRLAEFGKELADIHLFKSSRLDLPIAKYQGGGANDRVDYYRYDEDSESVKINPDKHFTGISPQLWNFHIGGYQVLHKYLKDRKGKTLTDPIHYCRMVTALDLTIQLQAQIDEIIGTVID